jgi:hypothetical protein
MPRTAEDQILVSSDVQRFNIGPPARVKWSALQLSIFHWSDTEISSFLKNQKSGIIARFTVDVRRIYRGL